MPLMRWAAPWTVCCFAMGAWGLASAAPPKVAAPAVPDRCLLGLKRKAIDSIETAVLSPTETVVLINQADKPAVLGICGEQGPLRGSTTLPRIEPYGDACRILGQTSCDAPPAFVESKFQPGASTLTARYFEVAPGEWTFAVERSASADTGNAKEGPGEEISLSALYVFRVVGGKLVRILMMPLRATRADAELSDSFETSVTQDSVGVLQFERTIKNGVYPDGVKERTRRGHLRWNGKRLVLGP